MTVLSKSIGADSGADTRFSRPSTEVYEGEFLTQPMFSDLSYEWNILCFIRYVQTLGEYRKAVRSTQYSHSSIRCVTVWKSLQCATVVDDDQNTN